MRKMRRELIHFTPWQEGLRSETTTIGLGYRSIVKGMLERVYNVGHFSRRMSSKRR